MADWGLHFTLPQNTNGSFGDWAVVEGPQSGVWGGSYICVSKQTDTPALVANILKTLCCDSGTMKSLAEDRIIFTNNRRSMTEISGSSFPSDLFGGQNPVNVIIKAADNAQANNIVHDDPYIDLLFWKASVQYFDGAVSKEQVIDIFYKSVAEEYPEIVTPDSGAS